MSMFRHFAGSLPKPSMLTLPWFAVEVAKAMKRELRRAGYRTRTVRGLGPRKPHEVWVDVSGDVVGPGWPERVRERVIAPAVGVLVAGIRQHGLRRLWRRSWGQMPGQMPAPAAHSVQVVSPELAVLAVRQYHVPTDSMRIRLSVLGGPA